jgi:hypothetical protein
MGAALAAVPGQVAGVEVAFVDEGGDQRSDAFSELCHVRFESVVAVRKFPSFPGQRSFSGLGGGRGLRPMWGSSCGWSAIT